MICPRCGFSCDETATFCLSCGTRLAEPQETAPAPSAEVVPIPQETAAPPAEDTSDATVNADGAVPPPPYQRSPTSPQPPMPPRPPYTPFPPSPTETPVSVWKWLGLMILESFVSVAHLALMFIYAFSETTSKSLKNYSRAKLILAALKLVFGIVIFCLAFSAIMEFAEMVIYYSYTYPM